VCVRCHGSELVSLSDQIHRILLLVACRQATCSCHTRLCRRHRQTRSSNRKARRTLQSRWALVPTPTWLQMSPRVTAPGYRRSCRPRSPAPRNGTATKPTSREWHGRMFWAGRHARCALVARGARLGSGVPPSDRSPAPFNSAKISFGPFGFGESTPSSIYRLAGVALARGPHQGARAFAPSSYQWHAWICPSRMCSRSTVLASSR
jgi:hypothetical protein